MDNRNCWIFQYTYQSRTDRLLESSKQGDVIPWLWGGQKIEPVEGDPVFYLRSGKPPKGYPKDVPWRGITGFGEVSGPLETLRAAQTNLGVPVATVGFVPQSPIADWRVWHDHRLAPVSVLFAQQGTNFRISEWAAQAITQSMLVHPEFASFVKPLPDVATPKPGDVLTQELSKRHLFFNPMAARTIHSLRAILGGRARPGPVEALSVLAALVHMGGKIRNDARAGALGGSLSRLLCPDGDETVFYRRLSEVSDPFPLLEKVDHRQVQETPSVGPYLGHFLDLVAADRNGREARNGGVLTTYEGLLAAFLNSDGIDKELSDIIGLSRTGIIDAVVEGAGERAYPAVVRRFRESTEIRGSTRSEDATGRIQPDVPPDEPVIDGSPLPTGPGIASALNDTVKHGEDFLDVKGEAKAFARLIASDGFEPPLAIGVFGHWGTGKTFFMDRIEEELRQLAPEDPKRKGRKIVSIKFNAWHYMETNVWASLVDVVFRELDGWLRRAARDKRSDKNVETLFEGLATAQTQRLEAIEAFAEKTIATDDVRRTVDQVRESQKMRWRDVAKALFDQQKTKDDMNTVAKAFGLGGLEDDGAKLEAAIGLLQDSTSEGKALWRNLRRQGVSVVMLLVLVGLVLVVPTLLAKFGQQFGISGSVSALSGLAASVAGWVGIAAARARWAVNALGRINDAFLIVEQNRPDAEKNTLAELEADLEGARQALARAEAAAADALHDLHAGSATGRIAAFIRSRAEDGTYSKHLGIIDTIRRDFEQLTVLMATSKDQVVAEKAALDRMRDDIELRIEAMRKRYDKEKNPAFEPVAAALDEMKETSDKNDALDIKIDRIVLYIDDLDRCPPEVVYRVLQAVHLFLNFPLFVVVVGVDTRWMETSLTSELKELVDGSKGATTQDYLEKIFQIPYWTRRMDDTASKGFVKGVLGRLPAEEEDSTDTDNEEEGRQDGGNGNPDGKDDEVNQKGLGASGEASSDEGEENNPDDEGDDALDSDEDEDEEPDIGRNAPAEARAVVLSDAERQAIEAFSPYAGRSPRQLLRFVNVYNLIKSVSNEDGSPLIDPETDPDLFKALLAQLAIATGAPEGAKAYFDALSASGNGMFPPVKQAGAVIQRPRTLFDLSKANFDKSSLSDVAEAEMKTIRETLSRFCHQADLSLEALTEAKKTQDDAVQERYRELYRKLKATAPIARRYTFAAIDAVLASETLEVSSNDTLDTSKEPES